MLQPNQPMGVPNQAATGQQAPKPQQIPAGALMGMMPQGGIMAPIDKVANAYQSDPKALEQKGMSGDLLAALALQRLKTQKEAAMREMQLAAAGQQQGPQPTVVDQLEQQTLDLTKQEMQQEQMETLQQKQSQAQQGQKRLMQAAMNPQAQGIGGLPAPNAAEPKAMAAGGIVAFAGGGNEELEFDPEAYTPSGRSPMAIASDYLPTLTKLTPEQESEMNRILRQYRGRVSARQAREIVQGKASESDIKPTEVVAPTAAPVVPPAAPTAASAAPSPARPPAPPAAPGASPAAPSAAPAAGGLNSLLQGAVKQGLSSPEDRAAAAKTEREQALQFIGYSPEDEAKRRQGLAAIEDIDTARFDPERMGNEQFARALAGGAGKGWVGNIGAGITREATRASDEQYRQQREAAAARNKAFEELIGKTQEIKKEAYGAGQKKEDIMSKDFQQSLASGSAMRNADVQAAVSAMNAAATRETAAAMRDANNFTRLQGALTNINKYREAARQKVLEQYTQYSGLAQMDPTKMDKSQKAEFDRLRSMVAKDIEIATKGFDEQAAALEQRLGYSNGQTGSTAGWGQVQQVGK